MAHVSTSWSFHWICVGHSSSTISCGNPNVGSSWFFHMRPSSTARLQSGKIQRWIFIRVKIQRWIFISILNQPQAMLIYPQWSLIKTLLAHPLVHIIKLRSDVLMIDVMHYGFGSGKNGNCSATHVVSILNSVSYLH